MKNKKKAIYITISFLVILLIIIIVIMVFYSKRMIKNDDKDMNLNNNSENNIIQDNNTLTEAEEADETSLNDMPFSVTNVTYFYTVENCIKDYINSIQKLQKEDTEENRKNLYYKLNDTYIQKNNITLDNVKEINLKDDCYLVGAIKMLQLYVSNSYVIRYSARTMFLDNDNKIYYFNFIVYVDYVNLSYSIEPASENGDDLSRINLKEEKEYIDENDYNKYTYEVMSQGDIANRYIRFFKTLCENVPDVAYEYLSDEYKQSECPNVEQFKTYLSNNKEKLKYMEVLSCDDITEVENGTKYICSNVSGGYFTIYENSIMDFKVTLNI